MITKHSYSGETFDKLFSDFKPKEESDGMTKEAASTLQGIHWDSGTMPSQESFNNVQEDIKTNLVEELKFAARNIGVKLAQSHLDEFASLVSKDRLVGKKLERAARVYVTKIEERIVPAQKRNNSGKLTEVFSAVNDNVKTVISSTSSPTVDDNNSAACGYLGSKTNPNSIWNVDALKKAAQTPSSDEITKKLKEERAETREKIKDSYWKALHEKLASKGLVPNRQVHSLSTEESHGFNTNLPENAMSIFGDHKDFENIPEKTAGETLADQNLERASKKTKENSEIHIESAKTTESKNWLFR